MHWAHSAIPDSPELVHMPKHFDLLHHSYPLDPWRLGKMRVLLLVAAMTAYALDPYTLGMYRTTRYRFKLIVLSQAPDPVFPFGKHRPPPIHTLPNPSRLLTTRLILRYRKNETHGRRNPPRLRDTRNIVSPSRWTTGTPRTERRSVSGTGSAWSITRGIVKRQSRCIC